MTHVLKRASGRWQEIFSALTPELHDAIARHPRHGPCPVHGGKDGFRLFADYRDTGGGVCNSCGAHPNGVLMMMWLTGQSKEQVEQQIATFLGDKVVTPFNCLSRAPTKSSSANPNMPDQKQMQILDRIWRASLTLNDTNANALRLYLTFRGVYSRRLPAILRMHPKLGYYEFDENGKSVLKAEYPAMIVPIVAPNGFVVGQQRTYLTTSGTKAPVENPKKTRSACENIAGSAVRLFPATDVLGIGEGVETMLAVELATAMPTWAATSAAMLRRVIVPKDVKTVFIWEDLDLNAAGETASAELSQRLQQEGRVVHVCRPHGPIRQSCKKRDWLNVLNEDGLDAFPFRSRAKQREAEETAGNQLRRPQQQS